MHGLFPPLQCIELEGANAHLDSAVVARGFLNCGVDRWVFGGILDFIF
jgi:hypothetical protein